MITFQQGNVFDTEAEAVVNTVNCVGVMGRGIALQCKRLFPDNYKYYTVACKEGKVEPGTMLVFNTGNILGKPRYVINFPTKVHWRKPSQIDYITSGLEDLVRVIQKLNIKSIAIPPLGCGLGGLDWNVVRPLIVTALTQVPDVDCKIFEPDAWGQAHEVVAGPCPELTVGRAALLYLMGAFIREGLDPFITLLEVQKLMYFIQVAGEPLRLNFVKATYGPYADNLRFVLQRLNGHYISGYQDGGDGPNKPLELMPSAEQMARAFLEGHVETIQRIIRVRELIEGFASQFGMELLATVHWLFTQESCTDLPKLEQGMRKWNLHKRQFTQYHIRIAFEHLQAKGWLATGK